MGVWLFCDKMSTEIYACDIKKVSKKLTRKKVQERFGIRKLLFIIFKVKDIGNSWYIDQQLANEIYTSLEYGKQYNNSTDYDERILKLFDTAISNNYTS